MPKDVWEIELKRAQEAIADNDLESAAETLTIASANAPDTYDAHFELADAWFDACDYGAAQRHYRAALGHEPEAADSLFGLAATLRVQEEYPESITLYERAFEIEPDRTAAYWELGYAREMNGDVALAEQAYRACLRHYPDHGMARHLMSAMIGETTARAPADYVADLFNDYASTFEEDLVDELGYSVPEQVRAYLDTFDQDAGRPDHLYDPVLDLGCGTGLIAEAIKQRTGAMDGVDLSENMIQIAEQKNRFDQTYILDAEGFLTDPSYGREAYELVVSGDALVYLGDLSGVFSGVARRLTPSGQFIFTLEQCETGDYQLLSTGRYGHSKTYIRELAEKTGLDIICLNPIVPRTDSGNNINGLLCHLKRP